MPLNEDAARALAESTLEESRKGASRERAREIAESTLDGHQKAAQELLGADFDTETYAPKSLRWTLARGDTVEEKRLRLKKKYPEGEIDVLPQSTVMGFETDTLVYRESPEQQWKMVEPQGFDAFDIPEAIAPSVESIVAETAMAIGSGGATVPTTVARQALGAFFGEAIEQGWQYLTGTQDQSFSEATLEAGKEGAYSGLGGFAASPFVGAYNIARGSGAMRVGDEGIDVLRAAEELDPNMAAKFTPGLVTDNPAMQVSERQASALLPGLRRRYRDLISTLDAAVRSSAPGNASNAMKEVTQGLRDFSDHFLRRLKNFSGFTDTSAKEGGEALQRGIAEYSEQSRLFVNELYDNARRIAEPEFDLKPVYDLANDIRAGAKGTIDPAVEKQIKLLENIDGPITLSDGKVLSVTDQIRNVRTELWSLRHVEPGKVANQKTGQANDLYKALSNSLENPVNPDDAFQGAWKAANEAASVRFSTLEKAPIVAAAKSETPETLVRTYVRPDNASNLLAIRETVSPEAWGKFQSSAYSDLIADPGKMLDRLKSFDQETLDVLMPRQHQEMFFKVGQEMQRIFKVGSDEIAERQVSNARFVDRLIRSSEPRDAQTLIRAMNNSNNKPMRDSARAAIVEWAWDGVVEPTKGGLRVNSGRLASRVQLLKESGVWSVLSVDERRIIGNAEVVGRAFQRVQDAGTELIAAAAVQGVKEVRPSAIMTFVHNSMFSWFVLSPMGKRMLIGSGLPNSNGAMLRLMAGATAQMSVPQDLEEETQ